MPGKKGVTPHDRGQVLGHYRIVEKLVPGV